MTVIDKISLNKRLELRKTRCISERLEKSPNLNVHCVVSDHLHIRLAARDVTALALIHESFNLAYGYVQTWFGRHADMVFDLWMAPELIDLQYMTCLSCDETFFCAPGSRNGMHIILFVSPQSCTKNADKGLLSGLFAHEITHHVVRNISQATVFSMKRKENLDVPMWLEEGLCQFIDSEVYPPFKQRRTKKIPRITRWYNRDELWNDLSSCEDPETAYLQAYKETRAVIETTGKTELIQLLYLNRTHEADWREMLHW